MCACGSGGLSQQSSGNPSLQRASNPISTDCGLTKTVLKTWFAGLICIKLQDKFVAAGIGVTVLNQILGVVQSALNYPDNYCYFYEMLEYFKDNLLPSIIANVPECFS